MATGRLADPYRGSARGSKDLSREPDERLLELFIERRDEIAFEVLVARHAPRAVPLRAVLVRRVVVRRSPWDMWSMGEDSSVLGSAPIISPPPRHIDSLR